MNFKYVDIQLQEQNHQYLIDGKHVAKYTFSGSSLFKIWFDDSKLQLSSKLHGKVAMALGTSIHKIVEDYIDYYNKTKDLEFLSVLALKYKYDCEILHNILINLQIALKSLDIKEIYTEIGKGIYDEEKSILFCGTADIVVILNNGKRIGLDIKTMNKSNDGIIKLNQVFKDVLNGLIYDNIDYKDYLYPNNIPYSKIVSYTTKSLNYMYQFGLYAILFQLDEFIMIPSSCQNILINNQDLILLKSKIKQRMQDLIKDI